MAGPSAQVKWTPEASILKPIDATVNSDEWPSFYLTDAAIYSKDGTSLANALLVGTEGPFVVRGKLEGEEEDGSQFVRPDVRSANIEINDCTLYSLGFDPLPLVWVSGHAGWFMINPSPTYIPFYNDICDVSVLYHHISEIYNTAVENAAKVEKKNVYANLSTKHILFEYAVAVGDGITYDELVDKCVRLAPLLLAHFASIKTFNWKTTGFVKWLTREIQDRGRTDRRSSRAISVTDNRSQSSPAPTAVPSSSAPQPSSSSSSTARPPSSLSHELPLRTPPRSSLNSNPPPDPPSTTAQPAAATSDAQTMDEADGRHAAALRMLLDGILEIGRDFHGDVSRISQSHIHGKLYNKFRLKFYTVAKDLSAYFATELLAALDHEWAESPYGLWLRTASSQPFVPVSPDFTVRDMPNQLVRRAGHINQRQRQGSATPTASSTPLRRDQQRSAGKALPSALSARRGGKHAALRLPLASKKRPHGSAFSNDNSDNDSIDDGDDAGTSSSADARGHDARRRKLANKNENEIGNDNETMLVVRSQPLAQSTAPTGPNRTWRCARPACGFFVRDAGPNFGTGGDLDDDSSDDDDESHDHVKIAQELVRQHIRAHEQETLNKVDLAITEGSRRHVSVSHLLDKIRNMGDTSSGGPAMDGVVAPSPIVRHFLV
ncbi:hypothetical protein CMQ_2561 [Grosmannia clavigera kw1407]|uniref:Uncharacterized protein n=1 Tax=Grosmannia clavigera (strain kw1407 / UAMH 11150) TaxID=655863 RepID=F0XIB9_GROCL|nr:uncharacterized protein CMQ_2561 [Grosmannia clavigera kw1407]EFX02632.1 hypothetical protein CMQ_2561 [Grosmannia clavigera kw1407]